MKPEYQIDNPKLRRAAFDPDQPHVYLKSVRKIVRTPKRLNLKAEQPVNRPVR